MTTTCPRSAPRNVAADQRPRAPLSFAEDDGRRDGGGAVDLRARAGRWAAEDPDPATRDEVTALLAAGDEAALAERFGARLEFGTAGLRGALGAGPARMNRAVVRQVSAGLA